MEDKNEVKVCVYEIGYLIASSVPEEKVKAEAEAVKSIITKAGASVIAEEDPRPERLAYTMRKKTVSGAYDKYTMAYFGWIKFEVGSDKIEAVKKAVEVYPSVLRTLMISTVKENTYLGKRAQAIAEEFAESGKKGKEYSLPPELAEVPAKSGEEKPAEKKGPITESEAEDIDKSIEAMVKEV